MKEQKPRGPGPVHQDNSLTDSTEDDPMKRGMTQSKPAAVRSIEDKPTRPEMPMHADTQNRRRGGRLGRDVQAKLGNILQTFYDDVVGEGVPDRFKELVQQLEERKDKGTT